jgi:hypothetical protein
MFMISLIYITIFWPTYVECILSKSSTAIMDPASVILRKQDLEHFVKPASYPDQAPPQIQGTYQNIELINPLLKVSGVRMTLEFRC